MMKIRANQWIAFGEAYSMRLPDHVDDHALFAEKLGISRGEAKELAYRMIHSNRAIKRSFKNIHDYYNP
ncbi:MAG: hypothetical protein ACRC6R_08040 [Bacteroidales bacterium]